MDRLARRPLGVGSPARWFFRPTAVLGTHPEVEQGQSPAAGPSDCRLSRRSKPCGSVVVPAPREDLARYALARPPQSGPVKPAVWR